MSTLPAGTLKMGAVSLTVSDLDRSLAYYQTHIGLRLLDHTANTAVLGIGESPLVYLHQLKDAVHLRGVTGLYHFAILLPSRPDLAAAFTHFVRAQTPLTGAADHLVSEAIYLSDPDGHGIEIYRDRSTDTWRGPDGAIKMDTLPLDVDDLVSELGEDAPEFDGLPKDTVMGHIHLHVAAIPPAEEFYMGLIGLDKSFSGREIPTASFLSAGGYHHHLAVNTWAGVDAPPPPDNAARLLNYEILFPDQTALDAVLARLDAHHIEPKSEERGWLVHDPSQNGVLLRTA